MYAAHIADQSQVKKYVLYLPPSPIPAGDSVQNILGDVLSCALGYILGTLFLALDLWWLSLVWVAVSEVTKFHENSLAALSSSYNSSPYSLVRWRAWPTCGTAW